MKTTTTMLLAIMVVSLATASTAYTANGETVVTKDSVGPNTQAFITKDSFEPKDSVGPNTQAFITKDSFEPKDSVGSEPQNSHLLAMIQELRAAIDRLDARITALESGSGTPPTSGVPDRITNLRASIDAGDIRLDWTTPNNNGNSITGYDARYSTTSSNGPWNLGTFPSTSPPGFLINPDSNTTYYWQVAAKNSIGTALWSNTASVSTGGSTPPTSGVPDRITNLRASIDAGDIRLDWTTPNNNGNSITGYDARYSTTSSNGPWNLGTFPSTSPPGFLINPDSNTTYYWQVAAKNSIGTALWSNTASVNTSGSGSQMTGIQGKVYTDTNFNNRLDPGERGRANIEVITVNLANHSDVQRLRTDANGDFTFNRAAGGYLLQAIGGGPNSYAYLTIPNNTMLTQNLAY